MRTTKLFYRRGFTVVELLVVIVVIGILAGISIVSYGAWRHSAIAAKVKSDLNNVASAMESARNFNNTYPSTVPSSITPTSGVSLSGGSSDGTTYCVDGASTEDTTVTYYLASETKAQGPLSGKCSTRPTIPAPGVPTNLAVVTAAGTTVNLSWTAAANANTYTAQCASDPAYVNGPQSVSVTSPTVTATVSGLTPSSSYYCHVNAVNVNGTSVWSANVNTTTTDAYGSLAVGTSIEGYWTTAPKGFVLEDGSAVSRTAYASLFAVIGTTYGAGDGSTTFNLPDSRGRTPVNKSTDVEFATIGQKTGSKTETLTVNQIPSHTHVQNAHNHSISDPGHNHSQNVHSHAEVVTALSGGGAIRNDYNGDAATAAYSQGISTSADIATNNPSTTGVSINSTVATNQNTGGDGAHNNIQPSIVKTFALKYVPPESNAAEFPAGTSISGYWSSIPSEYLAEDGSAVSRTAYPDLFAAIGTTYGAGDGSTTFNLPDSRGRASVNLSSADAEFNTMGEKYGEKTHILTIAEMPSHTHVQNAHAHGVSDPGHNHTQNPHAHTQYVTANSGCSAVRNDWDSDTNGGYYAQGISTDGSIATNNPSTTGITFNAATATNQNTGGGQSHNEIQPSITRLYAIKATPAVTTGTAIDPGTSVGGYWSSAPTGYLVEDGAAVSRTTYAALFAVIGTTYGAGDGSTTFNLPDSRGRVMVNKNPADTEFDTMGEKYGTKTETLSIAQMPSHTHVQNAHTHTVNDPGHNHTQNPHSHAQNVSNPLAGYPGVRSDYNADANGCTYPQNATTGYTTATNNPAYTNISVVATTAVNQNTGGSAAHNNIQPSIVKLYVIKY